MGEIDQGLQKGPIATSKPTEIWEMRGYVEFNLSQRCFGPAQFEATLLRQTYLRKIVSPRQKKRKRFPVSFFFFRVFVSSPSTVNRDESVDRLCTNENVGQRHRIDVSPRFFSYSSSSSSSNKIHPRLFENCMFFREISILTRHAAFMQFFLQNASFYKTRTRVTTYLSLSLSFSFLFLKKIGNNRLRPIILFTIVFASFRFSSKTRRNEFDRVLKFSYQDTRYFFFFPFATNLPRTNAQYHWKIDDDDDEKPRHLVRFLETTISIRLARSTLSFSRKRERRFANQGTKKKKKRKKRWKKSRTSIDEQRSSIS